MRRPAPIGPQGALPWRGVACILLLLPALSCAPEHDGRVIILGIDGASPRLVGPMMAAGRLPALTSVARAGCYSPYAIEVQPLASPVVWTTVATGRSPMRHGIHNFLAQDSEPRRLSNGTDRRGVALWNVVSAHERSVAIVNWWTTFPPERLRGIVVSDHALPGMMEGMARMFGVDQPEGGAAVAFPTPWAAHARAAVADPPTANEPSSPFSDAIELPESVRFDRMDEHFRRDLAVVRLLERSEREIRPDLTMATLFGIDRMSHFLWRYVDVDPEGADASLSASQRQAGRALLERYYELTDGFIATVLAPYDLERDLVIVLSDHGFERARSPKRFLSGQHLSTRAKDGVLFVAGRGVESCADIDQAGPEDVMPTVLAWLGIPVAEDVDGTVLSSLFPTDAVVAGAGTVGSWDHLPIDRVATEPSGVEGQLEDQLRSLGYID